VLTQFCFPFDQLRAARETKKIQSHRHLEREMDSDNSFQHTSNYSYLESVTPDFGDDGEEMVLDQFAHEADEDAVGTTFLDPFEPVYRSLAVAPAGPGHHFGRENIGFDHLGIAPPRPVLRRGDHESAVHFSAEHAMRKPTEGHEVSGAPSSGTISPRALSGCVPEAPYHLVSTHIRCTMALEDIIGRVTECLEDTPEISFEFKRDEFKVITK
jgi:hypothetical protein